jgi:hypothetical protein
LTFDREDAGVAGAEEFGGVRGELGTEAEEERSRVGADLLDGADDVDPDWEFFVGEEWCEMGEDAMAVELAALDEGEGARATERSGSVGRAAPDRFELDVAQTCKEKFRPLIFERSEGLGEGVLGPALWVGFWGVFEEAREGSG